MSTFQNVSTNRGSAILAQRAFYIIRRHARTSSQSSSERIPLNIPNSRETTIKYPLKMTNEVASATLVYEVAPVN